MQQDTRNTMIFFGVALAMLILYQLFILEPASKKREAEAKQKQAEISKTLPKTPQPAKPASLSRDAAKAATPRVALDNDQLTGSVNLVGGRIDDLQLDNYRQTTADNSPVVDLLRPQGTGNAWFVETGWQGDNIVGLPGSKTQWTLKEGTTLTPKTPILLSYTTPGGLEFNRRIAVDEHYLFTVTDSVTNRGTAPVTLRSTGKVERQGLPPMAGKEQNVHEGAVGWLDNELRLRKYSPWKKEEAKTFDSTGGWLGVTDKYWLAALIPDQGDSLKAAYDYQSVSGIDVYWTQYVGPDHNLAPGATATETVRIFAGAKRMELLSEIEKGLNIKNFDMAVDWGILWFLTRPLFTALEFFFGFVKNFGIAILLVTLCVRILLFPLANKGMESMSKLKKLAEPMKELREKYKDDPTKMQQETMALYQKEKVNPITGCLPLLLQIPIFLAMYKVLSVTIEMRHAPFFGFIKDLSARDPTNIWNLFGLLPYDPAGVPMIGWLLGGMVGLGVCVILYGFTMWLTTAMSPPAQDPMQQRIFQLMPIMFTFIMAPFAVGLIIYWTFSNILSIIQQYIIMHRLKVENPIDDFIAKIGGGKAVG